MKEYQIEGLTNEFGLSKIDYKSKARYIKVTIQAMDLIPEGLDGGGHVPWTFIDEIEIY